MAKLEDFFGADKMQPLSPGAQASLDAKVAAGGWSSADEAAKTKAIAEAAAVTTAGGVTTLIDNTNTDWINNKYRPMMGWTYMVICFADFILFPVLWSILQAVQGGQVTSAWSPLTLQGAGIIHLAFGAILGITSWGRSKEKLEGKA
jgi:hypothetical protein